MDAVNGERARVGSIERSNGGAEKAPAELQESAQNRVSISRDLELGIDYATLLETRNLHWPLSYHH